MAVEILWDLGQTSRERISAMDRDDIQKASPDPAPTEAKLPWQPPVVEHLNIREAENGETVFFPPDGTTCSIS
jgi:hypothetical protein